jgi:hypothetical protein
MKISLAIRLRRSSKLWGASTSCSGVTQALDLLNFAAVS